MFSLDFLKNHFLSALIVSQVLFKRSEKFIHKKSYGL